MGRQSRIQLLLRKGRRYSDAAILVFTAILAAEPDRFDQAAPFIASATRVGQDWAWVVILVSLVARWVCDWGLGVLGKRVLMPVVKEVLDRFRDGVFPEKKGDHAHHRVTLFLHRGLLLRGFDRKHGGWPWSGWLVPIARSGHTAQKTKVRFLAEGGTDRYQGIAGKAWATRRDMAPATSLPRPAPSGRHRSGLCQICRRYTCFPGFREEEIAARSFPDGVRARAVPWKSVGGYW